MKELINKKDVLKILKDYRKQYSAKKDYGEIALLRALNEEVLKLTPTKERKEG